MGAWPFLRAAWLRVARSCPAVMHYVQSRQKLGGWDWAAASIGMPLHFLILMCTVGLVP